MQGHIFRIAALSLSLLLVGDANACEWVNGYFYQVTHLQGKVVGRSLGPLQFRWLRRRFPVSSAELVLYDYNLPFSWDKKPPALALVKANSAGEFDFGNIQQGHYRLEIAGSGLHDLFDVEITNKAPATKSITIDVSPHFPDCSGGHEFEVETTIR